MKKQSCYFPRWVETLLFIANNNSTYAIQVSKKINVTYSHLVTLVREFERIGLITAEKTGRIKYLIITEKGKNMAKNLQMANQLLLERMVVEKDAKPRTSTKQK